MDTLLQDVRYAVRTLVRTPVFTLAVALTLALAIGANTVFYSAVHAVLMRPLPYAQPEQLVRIWDGQKGVERASVSEPEALAWRDGAKSLADLAAYHRADFNRTDGDAPERVQVARSTSNIFSLIGVTPALGRGLTAEDEAEGAPRVAVASHSYWTRRLGADPRALGRTLQLDGESYSLVGVLPEGFSFGDFRDEAELWVPRRLDASAQKGSHFLTVIARLAPGVTPEAAQADVARVNAAYTADNGAGQEHGAVVMGWQRMLTERTSGLLWALLGAVGFVLLIACANVANLMLVRALGRQREGAIRSAMGASRWCHVQQLLVESVLLALLGGALGLVLALWGMDLARLAVPERLQRVAPLSLSVPALLFNLGVSVGAGLLFGLVPALQASRPDLMGVLRTSGNAAGARARHPVRSALVVVQLVLALVLLVGTGLTVKMLRSLEQVDLGFEPKGLLTARVSLPEARYGEDAQKRAFWTQLLERVAAVPGVEAAGAISYLPLSGSNVNGDFRIDGRPTPEGERYITEKKLVTPDYFRAMRLDVKRGRAIGPQDVEGAPAGTVVNETFARRFFPGEDPVGKRVYLDITDGDVLWEVVGVVEDARQSRLQEAPRAEAYAPVAQVPPSAMTLVLRTRGAPAAATAQLRAAVALVDAQQPLYDVRTYEEVVENQLASERTGSRLFTTFAVLALVLAGVGIYGVMAYVVGQRGREMGIRRALGATETHVLGLVLGHGMRLTAVALGVGLVAAVALGRLLASSLFGVSAFEPVILLSVSALLCGVALLACWLPARRASRVDPAVVLRQE